MPQVGQMLHRQPHPLAVVGHNRRSPDVMAVVIQQRNRNSVPGQLIMQALQSLALNIQHHDARQAQLHAALNQASVKHLLIARAQNFDFVALRVGLIQRPFQHSRHMGRAGQAGHKAKSACRARHHRPRRFVAPVAQLFRRPLYPFSRLVADPNPVPSPIQNAGDSGSGDARSRRNVIHRHHVIRSM